MRAAIRLTAHPYRGATMSNGIPLLILALGTLGCVCLLGAAARKQVANSKGDPERSTVIRHHGGPPRPNMEGTEH